MSLKCTLSYCQCKKSRLLDQCLPLQETIKHLVFSLQGVHPSTVRFIINEGEKILKYQQIFIHFSTRQSELAQVLLCLAVVDLKCDAFLQYMFHKNRYLFITLQSNHSTSLHLVNFSRLCSPKWPYQRCHNLSLLSFSATYIQLVRISAIYTSDNRGSLLWLLQLVFVQNLTPPVVELSMIHNKV